MDIPYTVRPAAVALAIRDVEATKQIRTLPAGVHQPELFSGPKAGRAMAALPVS